LSWRRERGGGEHLELRGGDSLEQLRVMLTRGGRPDLFGEGFGLFALFHPDGPGGVVIGCLNAGVDY
jgi:hypothetical protein